MNITASAGDWTLICRDLNFGTNVSTCNWDRQPWPPVVARRVISTSLSAKLSEWLKPTLPRELGVTVPTPRREGGWITALQDILLDDYEVYFASNPLVNLRTSLGRGNDAFF
jgi:hypothetical protein